METRIEDPLQQIGAMGASAAKMETTVKNIEEKTNFMEQRLDHTAGFQKDVCRHLSQEMMQYDNKLKKIWLERRLREVMEVCICGCVKSGIMEEADQLKNWQFACSEVKMRTWRDEAMLQQSGPEALGWDEEMVEGHKFLLQNVQLTGVDLWQPLSGTVMEKLQVDDVKHWRNKLMVKQLLERVEEMKEFEAPKKDTLKPVSVPWRQ